MKAFGVLQRFCHFPHSLQAACSEMNAQAFFCVCNYIDEVLSAVALRSHTALPAQPQLCDLQPTQIISLTSSADNLSRIFAILPSWTFRNITFDFFIIQAKFSSTLQLAPSPAASPPPNTHTDSCVFH